MSLEFNKVAAAVLTAGVVAMFTGFIGNQLFSSPHLEENAYQIATLPEGGAGGGTAPAEETLDPILPLLASADPAKGQSVFKACVACHTTDKGGANKIGPNLWEIVNRPHAAHAGFAYSDVLKSMADKPWSYEELNHFLENPRKYAPGTKMTYAGVKKTQDRADLIAYLRTLSDNPAPLPTQEEIDALVQETAAGEAGTTEEAAPEEAAPEEAAPAEEEAASAEEEAAPAEEEAAPAEEETAPAEEEAAPAEETPAETGESGQSASDGAAPSDPLLAAIAAADPAEGQKVFRQCATCHTVAEGGSNKVGPNLWNVVGAPFGHIDNFNYSEAFKAAKAEGRTWSYQDLDAYLADPRGFLPGNKMTYAGVKKPEQRAAVIAYLRTLAAEPAPLE